MGPGPIILGVWFSSLCLIKLQVILLQLDTTFLLQVWMSWPPSYHKNGKAPSHCFPHVVSIPLCHIPKCFSCPFTFRAACRSPVKWSSLVAQMIIHIAGQCGRPGFNPWVGKIPWRRAWQPTPAVLPGEFLRTEEPSRLQSMRSQRV